MVLENFVQIVSRDGDTKLVYDIDDKSKYNDAKRTITDKLHAGYLMVGYRNGMAQCLANAYIHTEDSVTSTLLESPELAVAAKQDELDTILRDESIVEKTMSLPVTTG